MLSDAVRDADVVLTHLAPITASLFAAAPNLRVVGVTRGGPVNVDLDAATASGVPVVFLPGRNLEAVAEFTVGVMIAGPRGIASASRSLASGSWDPSYFRFERTGPELRSCTIGLIGAGAVGRRVAAMVSAFGAKVVIHDPFADEQELRAAGYEPVTLAALLAASDIVSVHARLTDATRGMFDTDAFAAIKPGAYFVNTARGEIVNRTALLAALESGQLSGAALDVFDPEPPDPHDPLLARSDVLATPHLAGSSRQVATESATRIATAVAHLLTTGSVDNCANPRWIEHAGHRP